MTIEITPMTATDYEAAITLWRSTPGIALSDADSREAIIAYLCGWEERCDLEILSRETAAP
jgi:hypothetical protein